MVGSLQDEIFVGRRVVVFSLPDAFTPTCSNEQCPAFERLYEDLREAGVDGVYCLAVNDAFVMCQWAEKLAVERVRFLRDAPLQLVLRQTSRDRSCCNLEAGSVEPGLEGCQTMTIGHSLDGQRIMVVEDEFFIADDAARVLREAGAEIVGPYSNEVAAHARLGDQRPDAVVVDINLGEGPSFALAHALKERGIPFLFLTGYDTEIIPQPFQNIELLEKPTDYHVVVSAIGKLLRLPQPGRGSYRTGG